MATMACTQVPKEGGGGDSKMSLTNVNIMPQISQ